MDASHLPPDLDALESQLRHLGVADPSPVWRGRMLCAVSRELLTERRRGWVRYAATLAALLVLWGNLSWMASRDTALFEAESSDVLDSAARIQALLPELSPREAARQGLLLDSGRRMSLGAASPAASPRAHRFTSF